MVDATVSMAGYQLVSGEVLALSPRAAGTKFVDLFFVRCCNFDENNPSLTLYSAGSTLRIDVDKTHSRTT